MIYFFIGLGLGLLLLLLCPLLLQLEGYLLPHRDLLGDGNLVRFVLPFQVCLLCQCLLRCQKGSVTLLLLLVLLSTFSESQLALLDFTVHYLD